MSEPFVAGAIMCEARSVPVNPTTAIIKKRRAVIVMAEDSTLRSTMKAGQLDNRRNKMGGGKKNKS